MGKLVKVAGGIMNTHSRVADCRNEIVVAHAALQGADVVTLKRLMECVSTDACVQVLDECGLKECGHLLDLGQNAVQLGASCGRRYEGWSSYVQQCIRNVGADRVCERDNIDFGKLSFGGFYTWYIS